MTRERLRQQIMSETSELFSSFPQQRESNFGHPPGVKVLTVFKDRNALIRARVHPSKFAGIGYDTIGAYSIVVSGGYEDDKDDGDQILYTGTGGQEDSLHNPGAQTEDQSFDHRMNKALKLSCDKSLPVRVIRGAKAKSKWAPEDGYRYDGLYKIVECFADKGISGYMVCRFKLVREPGQPAIPEL